jgi:hypothetical protein
VEGDDLRDIRFGALLHDIGKLALPDSILIKPAKLTEEETVVMRTHPGIGHGLLQRIDFLRGASAIPFSHHERWDGAGYPARVERRGDSPGGAYLQRCGCVGCAEFSARLQTRLARGGCPEISAGSRGNSVGPQARTAIHGKLSCSEDACASSGSLTSPSPIKRFAGISVMLRQRC